MFAICSYATARRMSPYFVGPEFSGISLYTNLSIQPYLGHLPLGQVSLDFDLSLEDVASRRRLCRCVRVERMAPLLESESEAENLKQCIGMMPLPNTHPRKLRVGYSTYSPASRMTNFGRAKFCFAIGLKSSANSPLGKSYRVPRISASPDREPRNHQALAL